MNKKGSKKPESGGFLNRPALARTAGGRKTGKCRGSPPLKKWRERARARATARGPTEKSKPGPGGGGDLKEGKNPEKPTLPPGSGGGGVPLGQYPK